MDQLSRSTSLNVRSTLTTRKTRKKRYLNDVRKRDESRREVVVEGEKGGNRKNKEFPLHLPFAG